MVQKLTLGLQLIKKHLGLCMPKWINIRIKYGILFGIRCVYIYI